MHHPLRDLHHLWVGPVVALALVALAGVVVNLIGEVP